MFLTINNNITSVIFLKRKHILEVMEINSYNISEVSTG